MEQQLKIDEKLDKLLDSFEESQDKNQENEEQIVSLKEQIAGYEKKFEKVEQDFKTVEINFNTFKKERDFKNTEFYFNKKTGKIVPETISIKSKNAFQNMITALTKGDTNSAHSISDEIDEENKLLDEKTAYTSDVDAQGGFSLPQDMSDQMMMLTYENSVMAQNLRTENIMLNERIYPLFSGGEDVGYIASQSTALTEINGTLKQVGVESKRCGAFSDLSNTLIRQKADFTRAVISSMASGIASFIDLHSSVGLSTLATDEVSGLAFDSNTKRDNTNLTYANLTIEKLIQLVHQLSSRCKKSDIKLFGNRNIEAHIGLLQKGDTMLFPSYATAGSGGLRIVGADFITNTEIPDTLTVIGTAARSGGSKTALIICDTSKIVQAMSNPRIDSSTHVRFKDDMTTIRCLFNFGQKVLAGASDLGLVSIAQSVG